MNLLSELSEGNVTMKHHSTSSCIYITIDLKVETSQGVFENDKQSFFVDYTTFVSSMCEHPWESIIGDGEMKPAKCLKCGKYINTSL